LNAHSILDCAIFLKDGEAITGVGFASGFAFGSLFGLMGTDLPMRGSVAWGFHNFPSAAVVNNSV
jgi:hypothetical protein